VNKIYIAIDGFDTPYAGCTTHFTVFLLKKIMNKISSVELEKNPFLVRLNPAVPWRTRGNASISLVLSVGDGRGLNRIIDVSKEAVAKYTEAIGGNKGTIIIAEPSEGLESFSTRVYKKAVVDIVPRELVLRKLENIRYVRLIGRESVVGAVSAIGFLNKEGEHSYELIAYREPGRIGKRRVSDESVLEAERMYNTLFNNYDYLRKRSVASPAGPDPVLIGLRGLDAYDLVKAFDEIEIGEPVWAKCLFITNQHTDAHMVPRVIGSLRIYQTGFVEGVVVSEPRVKKKGHTEIVLTDSTWYIKTIFFAETRPMNKIAQKLRMGDSNLISFTFFLSINLTSSPPLVTINDLQLFSGK
jgi:tRNA(Ile2)-agmatinylcytidine synthase